MVGFAPQPPPAATCLPPHCRSDDERGREGERRDSEIERERERERKKERERERERETTSLQGR